MMGRSSGSSVGTKVSLSRWKISSHPDQGQQHRVSYLPRRTGPPSFPSDLLRDGAEAAGGGLTSHSQEGVENDSDFLFWPFNLH